MRTVFASLTITNGEVESETMSLMLRRKNVVAIFCFHIYSSHELFFLRYDVILVASFSFSSAVDLQARCARVPNIDMPRKFFRCCGLTYFSQHNVTSIVLVKELLFNFRHIALVHLGSWFSIVA